MIATRVRKQNDRVESEGEGGEGGGGAIREGRGWELSEGEGGGGGLLLEKAGGGN